MLTSINPDPNTIQREQFFDDSFKINTITPDNFYTLGSCIDMKKLASQKNKAISLRWKSFIYTLSILNLLAYESYK